jgi:uroporphyrinogen decarboxylase
MHVKLDLQRFWEENRLSEGRPFRTDKPRCPVRLPVDDHWLMQEMQVPSTVRFYRDDDYRARLHRECNDRFEAAIGRRPFSDAVAESPPPLRIEHVFGCRTEIIEGGTPWLEPGISTIEELSAMLDRLEKMNDAALRQLILSSGARLKRREAGGNGQKTVHRAASRGPATIATSVIGTTTCLYWLVDYPAEMQRFFEVLADTLVRYHRIIADETGVTFRGYSFLDDNCALLSPEMYERFCFPVLKRVFEAFAPDPADLRYQHSDSAMGHLLPVLSRLQFHAVNFGPTVPAAEIRWHMPRTEIHGQIAPNTLREGTFEQVVGEVQRGFAAVGADGGLLVTTAGSISAGTTLDRIRWLMWAAERHTRYDAG